MKLKFEIKNWITGKVMFILEGESWKLAFTAAIKAGQKFKEADLSGKDFSGVEVTEGDFYNSRFDNSRFDNSRFDNSSFYNSSFDNSRFDNSRFDNSSFDNSRFYNSSFYNSSFDNSRFDNSRFDNSRFDNSRFYNSSFDNSRFYNSSFYNSRFDNSRFDNSRFDNSRFDNSRFYNSSFYNSSFDNSRFDNSRFDNSRFDNSSFDEKSFKTIPQIYLDACRDDMFAVLLAYPGEVAALRKALIDGKVNGSVYSGKCACLFGTIAIARKCEVNDLKAIVKPNTRRPIEVFFYAITEGGTPDKNPFANLAVEWIDQFLDLLTAACKAHAKK